MKLHLKLNNNNNIYYSCAKCYSYDFFMAYIDGGRGIGKTTTFLIKAIEEVNKGGEFIYLRRYKPEIKKFINNCPIDKIVKEEVAYKGMGNSAYKIIVKDTVLGYAIPLATQVAFKSVDFSKVKLVIFDEAILKPSATLRYLANEVQDFFLEFISTVQRTRTDLKVVVLGNNVDLFSPYASFFELPIYDKIWYDKKRRLYCEHAKNSPALIEMEKKTGLYSLIEGTAYADYHYDNKVLTNEQYNIVEKPNNTSLMFRITVDKQTVNVYQFNTDGDTCLYCEWKDKYIDDNITYHLLDKGKINYLHAQTFKMKLLHYLFRHYYNNRIVYSSDKAGAIITWLIEEVK